MNHRFDAGHKEAELKLRRAATAAFGVVAVCLQGSLSKICIQSNPQ
jgi:hypothetical protein